MNNTVINYLCDGGADQSILSKTGFIKLKTANMDTKLLPYDGFRLKSASGQINVIGTTILKQCIIDQQYPLENQHITVAALQTGTECIIGRDIMNQIPYLCVHMKKMKHYILKKSLDNARILRSTVEFLNHTDSVSHIMLLQQNKDEIELEHQIRSEIEELFRTVAARNYKELTPSNTIMHEIRMINQNQVPIKQKLRPIHESQRNAFKQILVEQVEAGLIQASNSPWSSPVNS